VKKVVLIVVAGGAKGEGANAGFTFSQWFLQRETLLNEPDNPVGLRSVGMDGAGAARVVPYPEGGVVDFWLWQA